jgi:5-methylcytosine-specific restriction endonuclease McrA
MWGEPLPTWRKALKEYQCDGEGCNKIIAKRDRYLDRVVRHPKNHHRRYCEDCGPSVLEGAQGYHLLNGRNDFPDRYQNAIGSKHWKLLKGDVIQQRGLRCERCDSYEALELHHLHYRTLGSERPEDVELLCPKCHVAADEERAAKRRRKPDASHEGMIVGPNGDSWGTFDPNTIYIPLPDGRYLPISSGPKLGKPSAHARPNRGSRPP